MKTNENDQPPERHRLDRASRTFRNLRGKPVLPKRKIEDIPPYERLPGRLLKQTLPRPADPKEAKRWLRKLADYLSTDPNASRRFRFIAYAIKQFLRGEKRLSEALGLTLGKNVKRGRPPTPPETVTRVVSMLRKKTPGSSVVKATGVSRDTVQTIRADMGKTTNAVPDYERDEDGDVRSAEWKKAVDRAQTVAPERRRAIIEGIANNIELRDLIDAPDPPDISTQAVTLKRKSNPAPRKSK